MVKVFRIMTPDGDKPLVGDTARSLGVRTPADITPSADGIVKPGSGGMSVAPCLNSLPFERVPRRLRHLVRGAKGKDVDFCWSIGDKGFEDCRFTDCLSLRCTSPSHGLVEPSEIMKVEEFKVELAATRDKWAKDEG